MLKAWKDGWTESDPVSESFYIDFGTLATPTFSLSPDTYTEVQTLVISTADPEATIRYTTDGSDPTWDSAQFTGPITVDATVTIKAAAFKSGWEPSNTASASYTIDLGEAAPPTMDPPAGRYFTEQTVTLTSTTGSATIYYTMDGSDPDDQDSSVASGSSVTVDQSVALKAVAYAAGVDPSPIRTGHYWITGAVEAGREHGIGLKTDGTVWTWGYNSDGQHCDGTSSSGTPAQVSGVTALSVAAYGFSNGARSFIVKDDGTVWGCGSNGYGQLGDDSTSSSNTLVQVDSLTDAVQVSAGRYHTLALDDSGDVWAWGRNNYGQLGDNTRTSRTWWTFRPGTERPSRSSPMARCGPGVTTPTAISVTGPPPSGTLRCRWWGLPAWWTWKRATST